jgi:subtilisin family serine protease
MRPTPHPPPGGSRRGRRLLVLVSTLAMLLAAQPMPAGGAEESTGAGAATRPATAAGTAHPITLITGDLVMLRVAPDGAQAAWLAEPATGEPSRPPRIIQLDGQVHVIPAEAEAYLSAGVLDARLFNVTALARQGYDDVSRSDLPLLLASPEGPAPAGEPGLPAGASEVRRLDSIGAVSVTVDRSRMRQFWESLRGPVPAAPGGEDAVLAGADRVWLNGRVEATLGDSVSHVGAPAAWQAGLDGSGSRVAVLDTGYDPDHPDLTGQVVTSRTFTGEGSADDGNGHGTHVAATIAGTGAASGGDRTGVAPGADLLVGKVLDNTGAGLEDWVIDGMEWAVDQDADVVNMSLATPWPTDGTDPLSLAVDRLSESSGALFVVAAGNSGPFERSVGAPGAATRALTVGATTKDDAPAPLSSRGPRLGDEAIKPEIVAPGVGIVAARAGGTSLGDLVDARYTSLSGTSMATPHVAGAAAILAQQHPDWDADEIKARLTSTSTPLAGQPVTFQGGGRLDITTAVNAPVTVEHGILSLGRVDHGAEEVVRTLTYHNVSDEPVTLRLSRDVTSTGSRTDLKPDLRLRPAALVVPAGGDASVELELSPDSTKPGRYAGWITAEDKRGSSPAVHTALSLTVESPPHTVTVTGVDRNGDPAAGRVQLWNADTGEDTFGFMRDGTVTLRVPTGLYTMVTTLETMEGGLWPPTSYTIAGNPQLTVGRDLDFTYDARDAEPVRVTTPRHAEVARFDVTWHREAGDRSASAIAAQGFAGVDLYAIAGKAAKTGSFEMSTSWQMPQPLMTVGFDGAGGDRNEPTPDLASAPNAYSGQVSLPVVDVGTGTPEEFADVDVAGKVALVARSGEWGQLRGQITAARDAGAELLLAYNTMPGTWSEDAWNAPLPAYRMDQAAGTALRQAVAADPDLTVDLFAVTDATYLYQLFFTETGAVPGGRDYQADERPMAVVQSDFRQDSERMGRNEMWIPYPDSGALPTGSGLTRNGPVRRTEYVSTEGVRWQRFGQPHGEFPGVYWTWSSPRRYQPDQSYRQVWWGPLTRPGVPRGSGAEQAGAPVARFHDAIRILMWHYLYDNGSTYGTIFQQMGDTSTVTLRRNGAVVGSSSWPEVQFTVPPDEAWYELRLEVRSGAGNWRDTSVRTDSTWRFTSARPAEPRAVLPLVQVDYHLDTGRYNEVPAGTAYDLVLEPGYQPQAEGPGAFTVTVEVSYDDGQTWTESPVEVTGGRHTARISAAPAAAGFATVRVVATDADGNQLHQLIQRAWRVG